MPRYPRKIVEKTYYYASESESETETETNDGHVARFVFPDGDETWIDDLESDSESGDDTEYDPTDDSEEDEEEEDETDEEISDSEDGTDYESETEPESVSEDLDDPEPYHGKGFRVYFDSHADKKFFMKAFGFSSA